ncbi:hypothetical protein SO802_001269 [Lithocarpus litseifolius]|uniref:Seed maturation-like protein n=1 Tax=Lithocarpus litseifolius TaxID=425828 RepID=A0AAW2DY57_9ROSI
MASASAARAFILSRVTDLSLKPLHNHQPLLLHHHPQLPSCHPRRPRYAASATSAVNCLISGVDGGGVSDDFAISTRNSKLDRGFSVIANMLKKIEPLDTSVVSKAVSDSAKDSMKQTISTMLGLLPSDQFSVTVSVSKRPLHRLLVSSIITGYTLWNAEYRISLMRNLEISPDSLKNLKCSERRREVEENKVEEESKVRDSGGGGDISIEDLERRAPQIFRDLSPEALNYIQKLQSELSNVKEELDAQKQENLKIEFDRENRNNLLEYLRSLDSDMVVELSRPSSLEVEDIIHQLVQNILHRFFKDETPSDFMVDSVKAGTENRPDGDDELCDTIGTSRDYLAKLLFWCMLLGHHLRGLENRLHLTCVIGLL